MGVSFVHGSNDGQKGIGMIMLVLIGVVPGHFVVNLESTAYPGGPDPGCRAAYADLL